MLRTITLFLSVFATLFFISSEVFAGYAFTPSVSFAPKQASQQGSATQSTSSAVDFRLGYVFDFGLYAGGLYSLSDEKIPDGSNGAASYVVGPTIGYTKWNAFAFLTYIVSGERDLNNGGLKQSGAEGIHADFGYVFALTKTFSLGPQISYKKITYRNFESDGIRQASDDFKWDLWTPAVVAWFSF